MLVHPLIDPADSILIVIDVQPAFLDKLPRAESEQILNRVCWLTKLARWCQIPLIVTGEEIQEQPLEAKLLATLPISTTSLNKTVFNKVVFNKTVFGLAHQPDILAAVEQTGRRTAILIGLETDVCVMHSALGLLEQGYRVAVVIDATGSPAPNHELGLNRMQLAGVTMTNMKGIFYEWLRTVEMVDRFHRENPDMRAAARIEL